jgi:uncharacterized membrane protein YphA (DoxX/SURF4 family)
VGLLILRLVLAACLTVEGFRRLAAALEGIVGADSGASVVFACLLILCGALVALGFLTPLLQTLVAIVELAGAGIQLSPFGTAMLTIPVVWYVSILEAAMAVSLALIGPGAYSVDALLFGRREIIIPAGQRPPAE